MLPMAERDYLTPREVARLAELSHMSIHRYLRQGRLKAWATPGGFLRIRKPEVAAFLRQRGLPVPRELDTKVRVFIVDDDAMVRRALRSVLRAAPFPIAATEFEVPERALVAIGADKPDVVLLDANMPGLNGVELCKAIRANPLTSHVIVIGISGFREKYRDAFVAAGLDAFIEKPFDGKVVVPLIQLLLAKAHGPGRVQLGGHG